MDIQIVKASKDNYWYSNHIGEFFEVTGVQDNIYEVRKWIEYPDKYDIAPVLKSDCKEFYTKKKHGEAQRNPHWRMRIDPIIDRAKLAERSGFNTSREIEYYERLNKNAEIKESGNSDLKSDKT